MTPISGQWLGQLGAVAQTIGRVEFHARLLGLYGALVRHDIATVVRYSRFSSPDFLFHRGYSDAMVARYLVEYYRFDPFYAHWRSSERPGVVTLHDFPVEQLKQSRYILDFLSESRIDDEIGILLPSVGRACVAMFLERGRGSFTQAEIQRVKRMYPAMAGLHRAHVNAVFASLQTARLGATALTGRPALIVDRGGQTVFCNAEWQAAECRLEIEVACRRLEAKGLGDIKIGEGRILHYEPLGDDFLLAPGGRIYLLEKTAERPLLASPQEVVHKLDWPLTARETDIVVLILKGHPTASIAERLGLSKGTVKNHRRRIYYKLDITTERELFLEYIHALSRLDPRG